MPNSINWKIATLAAELTADGLIDSDALAFDLPIDVAVKTPSTSFSSASWPGSLAGLQSLYDENGVLYIAAEDADFEGAATFWDSGQNSFETISFTEWGGTQGVQTATITETSTPDYNTQYKDADVELSAPSISDKNIGEDPLSSISWTTSGTPVTLSAANTYNITVYNPNLQGNTDGSTTVTLTLTDNQGQTSTDSITISWRANRNPTAPTAISFNRTQPVSSGTSVTATASGATDLEGDTIYYQFEQVGSTPSLGISTSWSTSTSRSFTVPEYDDGSDSWTVSVRARTSRSSSGTDPSSWFTTTFTGKRPRRYSDYFVIQSITEYNRGSSTSSFNPGNISYPSNIQEGDLLFLSFGAYTPPGGVSWNNVTTTSGSAVAIKGDDLNNSANTAYAPTITPNSYRNSEPDIVSTAGWERAYNTQTNASSTTASTYARTGGFASHVLAADGAIDLAVTPTIDQFYKITTGTESGTIPLWDWTPTSSFGYGHTHMGEVVFVTHVRLYDKFNNAVKISEVSQIYANNNAWRRQISTISGYNFEYTFTHNTIGGNGCTDDCIFLAGHILSNGDYNSATGKYMLRHESTTGQNDGLYTYGIENYRTIASANETGDTYASTSVAPTISGVINIKDYNIDDYRKGRYQQSEVWASAGSSNDDQIGGTNVGVIINALQGTNITCLRLDDVKRVSSRDLKFGYQHDTSAVARETNNQTGLHHSSGGVAILQLKAHDTLYDGAY